MKASEIIKEYISFFEERGHKRIPNSPLIPQNDPTTLFTSSGMQPLVQYFLGEKHPLGKRLVNVQNCFRAQDIDEVGDNRHTTFFRMLGNWSLGEYFKKEQIPWFWEFLTKGEPGGPDSEVFFDLQSPHDKKYGKNCHPNCQCGRFLEIGNSVFMEYQKTEDGFKPLPNKNVDFGGGLERLLASVENQNDIFQTSLYSPIVSAIEKTTGSSYKENSRAIRIIVDHFVAAVFIVKSGVSPSNKEQGYVLSRLVRRAFDNINSIREIENMVVSTKTVVESIISQYKTTDPDLVQNFERIVSTILEEINKYRFTINKARSFIQKKYPQIGDELKGVKKISIDDAFILYSTHGLSPTQIKSLGYVFSVREFAKKMEEHQRVSRKGAQGKFAGGLVDHSDQTIIGHTATHLMHQALRDVLGNKVFQTGSNITSERIRFDFSYDRKLTDEEILEVEEIVNEKIEENLPVHFEMMPLEEAKEIGAIGLFDEKYEDNVKVYFINGSAGSPQDAYSIEFCGGPHVEFTGRLKRFKIIKQENIGHGQKRIYAKVSAL